MTLTDKQYLWMVVVVVLIVVVVSVCWSVLQWVECREAGFSVFYCIQHIG